MLFHHVPVSRSKQGCINERMNVRLFPRKSPAYYMFKSLLSHLPYYQSCYFSVRAQPVYFPIYRVCVCDSLPHSILQIHLALQTVFPGRRVGVLFYHYHLSYTLAKYSSFLSIPSKSAINVHAPEFKALIMILRSTGLVISTRRSKSPGPGGALRQVGSLRICAVDDRKSGSTPWSNSCCLLVRWQSSSLRLPEKLLCRNARNWSASTDSVSACLPVLTGPKMVTPVTGVLNTDTAGGAILRKIV